MTGEPELLDAFERMLGALFTPAQLRAIERGDEWQGAWQEIEQSGFLDALVPAASGGAGLTLGEVAPLLIALGRHAAPLPIGETMLARALIVQTEAPCPRGPIALGTLAPFDAVPANAMPANVDGEAQRLHAALLRAAQLAGAAQRVLEMTVSHANQRVQFGKLIGRQQAIQQQLAVMAEQVVAMRMAVELACGGEGTPSLLPVAAAKALASEYAPLVSACAHGVHGAIGITEECDLQLWTRRLLGWSRIDGGAAYWNDVLGRAVLASDLGAVEWVRQNLFARGAQD